MIDDPYDLEQKQIAVIMQEWLEKVLKCHQSKKLIAKMENGFMHSCYYFHFENDSKVLFGKAYEYSSACHFSLISAKFLRIGRKQFLTGPDFWRWLQAVDMVLASKTGLENRQDRGPKPLRLRASYSLAKQPASETGFSESM